MSQQPEHETDRIYQNDQGDVANFAFDHAVARVFPDMIKRSVINEQERLHEPKDVMSLNHRTSC